MNLNTFQIEILRKPSIKYPNTADDYFGESSSRLFYYLLRINLSFTGKKAGPKQPPITSQRSSDW